MRHTFKTSMVSFTNIWYRLPQFKTTHVLDDEVIREKTAQNKLSVNNVKRAGASFTRLR